MGRNTGRNTQREAAQQLFLPQCQKIEWFVCKGNGVQFLRQIYSAGDRHTSLQCALVLS